MKTHDTVFKNTLSSNIENKSYDNNVYRRGVVSSNYGIVEVYSQKNLDHSNFSMVINGFYLSRSIPKYYTKIGLARIANKYAKEMYIKYGGKCNKLISADDDTPEISKECLFYTATCNETYFGFYDGRSFVYFDRFSLHFEAVENVTYWRHLPELP